MECEALDFSSKLTSLFRQTKFEENIFFIWNNIKAIEW
jgi:hypothetical protein